MRAGDDERRNNYEWPYGKEATLFSFHILKLKPLQNESLKIKKEYV